jgi:hypothetical protein
MKTLIMTVATAVAVVSFTGCNSAQNKWVSGNGKTQALSGDFAMSVSRTNPTVDTYELAHNYSFEGAVFPVIPHNTRGVANARLGADNIEIVFKETENVRLVVTNIKYTADSGLEHWESVDTRTSVTDSDAHTHKIFLNAEALAATFKKLQAMGENADGAVTADIELMDGDLSQIEASYLGLKPIARKVAKSPRHLGRLYIPVSVSRLAHERLNATARQDWTAEVDGPIAGSTAVNDMVSVNAEVKINAKDKKCDVTISELLLASGTWTDVASVKKEVNCDQIDHVLVLEGVGRIAPGGYEFSFYINPQVFAGQPNDFLAAEQALKEIKVPLESQDPLGMN